MNWQAWAATDAALRTDFGYDAGVDRAAAKELHAFVPAVNRLRNLGVDVRNRANVAVVGCGPSIERTPAALFSGKVIVAADGACTWLRENGLVPHIVVTDLDGAEEDLQWAAAQGAFMVVHAHGDNRLAIARLAPGFRRTLYGTYQVAPETSLAPMASVGGFTDGDRAVVLCEHLGARVATLYGYDFDQAPSRYSGTWNPATKLRKLAWAARIVGEVAGRGKMHVQLFRP